MINAVKTERMTPAINGRKQHCTIWKTSCRKIFKNKTTTNLQVYPIFRINITLDKLKYSITINSDENGLLGKYFYLKTI